MMGFGAAATPSLYTPSRSGWVNVWFDAQASSTVASDAITPQLAYGTGSAPAAGAAATGTVLGASGLLTVPNNNGFAACSCLGRVQLTVGTTYWFDIQASRFSGSGTYTFFNPIFPFPQDAPGTPLTGLLGRLDRLALRVVQQDQQDQQDQQARLEILGIPDQQARLELQVPPVPEVRRVPPGPVLPVDFLR